MTPDERDGSKRLDLALDGDCLAFLAATAFGPPRARQGPVGDPARFERLADALSLTPRVATRLARGELEELVGCAVAGRFRHRRMLAAAANVASASLVTELALAGASSGIDVAVLKHGALLVEGVVLEGAREACDVDVLVPEVEAERYFERLVAAGFRASPKGPSDHQLPALHHPSRGTVEIHRFLPGVRREKGERFARLEDLRAGGGLRRASFEGVEVSVLTRPVLAAHLVAHGVAQHGRRPETYPILRMFGDLSDLGLFRSGEDRVLEEVYSWVRADVSRRRFDSMLALGRALEEGIQPQRMPPNARRLFSHIVLGTLDTDYAAMMRLAIIRPLSDASLGARGVTLARAIFPKKGSSALAKTVDPPGWPRLLRNRYARPLALAVRFLGSMAAAGRFAARSAWQGLA